MPNHTDEQFEALLTVIAELAPRVEDSRYILQIVELEKKLIASRTYGRKWRDREYEQREEIRAMSRRRELEQREENSACEKHIFAMEVRLAACEQERADLTTRLDTAEKVIAAFTDDAHMEIDESVPDTGN